MALFKIKGFFFKKKPTKPPHGKKNCENLKRKRKNNKKYEENKKQIMKNMKIILHDYNTA
jgi:hypothetical protein